MNKKYLDKLRQDPEIIKGVLDEANAVHRSKVALTKITPDVQKILRKIKRNFITLLIKYEGDMMKFPVKDDHYDFPSLHHDSAVLSQAIEQNPFPDEFFMPLGGGMSYLEHVLDCPFCQYLVGVLDDSDTGTIESEGEEILMRIYLEDERRKKIN